MIKYSYEIKLARFKLGLPNAERTGTDEPSRMPRPEGRRAARREVRTGSVNKPRLPSEEDEKEIPLSPEQLHHHHHLAHPISGFHLRLHVQQAQSEARSPNGSQHRRLPPPQPPPSLVGHEDASRKLLNPREPADRRASDVLQHRRDGIYGSRELRPGRV